MKIFLIKWKCLYIYYKHVSVKDVKTDKNIVQFKTVTQ